MRLHLTAACAAMALTLGSALAADTAPASPEATTTMAATAHAGRIQVKRKKSTACRVEHIDLLLRDAGRLQRVCLFPGAGWTDMLRRLEQHGIHLP